MRVLPAHPPGVSTNIYEGLVTRNVTVPTYDVDKVGYALALHPAARTIPGYGLQPSVGALVATPPPPKLMLDRSMPLDAPPADYRAPITYFPTTYTGY